MNSKLFTINDHECGNAFLLKAFSTFGNSVLCCECRSLGSTHTDNPLITPIFHQESQLAGRVKTIVKTPPPPPQHHSYCYPPYPTELHTFINNYHITSSDKQRLCKGMANLYTIILITAAGNLYPILWNRGRRTAMRTGVFLKKHLKYNKDVCPTKRSLKRKMDWWLVLCGFCTVSSILSIFFSSHN